MNELVQIGTLQPEARVGQDAGVDLVPLLAADSVQAEHLATAPLPAQIESRVADHAQQPGLERAAAFKARQMGQGLEKAVLHGIQSIRLVVEQAVRDAVSQ